MKRCANPRCKHNFTNDEKSILCERCRTKLAGNAKRVAACVVGVACVVAAKFVNATVKKS